MVLNRRNCSLLGKLGVLAACNALSGRTGKTNKSKRRTTGKKLGI
jgi:hypothetical protein